MAFRLSLEDRLDKSCMFQQRLVRLGGFEEMMKALIQRPGGLSGKKRQVQWADHLGCEEVEYEPFKSEVFLNLLTISL